ncbi:RANG protein, partial [Polyodon spathula]|nr:RANG protein [Polyodon spathula]
GSALGLASRTLSARPFHSMPWTDFMALSRSSSLRKVTKAKGCLPNSLILWGFTPCFSRNFFRSLNPTNLGRFWISTLKISEETQKEDPTTEETSTENTEDANHDPHFEPIVSLPEQEVKTLEEDEEELFKMRAKLYRFASENEPPEWKERGTGDVKLLRHADRGTIRLLMRRDKTLKICANHYISPVMELKPNAGSDRAWVWNTHADFADEHPKPELLAIRFLNAENAQKFKAKFDDCREEVKKFQQGTSSCFSFIGRIGRHCLFN